MAKVTTIQTLSSASKIITWQSRQRDGPKKPQVPPQSRSGSDARAPTASSTPPLLTLHSAQSLRRSPLRQIATLRQILPKLLIHQLSHTNTTQLYTMSERGQFRGGARGGRGGNRGGGRGGNNNQHQNNRNNNQNDSETPRPKKENILDLNKYMDKEIQVKFSGGREVTGTLKGYDQLMNLVLDDVKEITRDDEGNTSSRPLGLLVARGTLLVLISPLDGSEEIANPFVQTEEENAAPAI
ncbi:U6 snRNA-associated Sm-like protein LSm7 [Aureobasidium pullulans]|uniref:U6 snRNA-associated Sm-like protein LSm7 n=1 Tax=Aureobasidium pullulans TaxID=5580 RepID=A0A4S8SV13_AURPU|nr:U6 snRNA-associated Sm-like protein LSm7 [Aureobasidium pullulans]THV91505.1 U6 snRNA-associated Sm-like protein LSm7 [Aureobasidium pullulans]THW16300.1 U6 snRNA-associated Sm-like protein LSm7 [Aureobasidium pullulans]THW68475.1 U6 snRNA-associated Sm-like protein LSm7 [Aureobasidium pullulans]